MSSLVHLATRFLGSLSPVPLARDDVEWVAGVLSERELELWGRMSRPDRKHAAGVARAVAAELGDDATRPVLAAALLHDVGKIEAGLGTFGRVFATVVGRDAGPETAKELQRGRGLRRRIGLYLRHDQVGGDLLGMAGADPLTEAWAREHHLPPERWTVPAEVGRVLKACDDD